MTNILLIVRVKKRAGDASTYAGLRLRDQAGEVVDWLPDGTWPGNEIIDNPDFRIIRVTGQAMTEDLAASLCAADLLGPADLGKNFLPRLKIWQINYSLLPPVVLNALRIKIPFTIRGTIYDATYTVAQVQNVLKRKIDEPRDGQGQPIDDGEALPDIG